MVCEFFGKHIMQPYCDIFEKAIGRAVSQSTRSSFLTQVEAESVMSIARQHDLSSLHADTACPGGSPTGKQPLYQPESSLWS